MTLKKEFEKAFEKEFEDDSSNFSPEDWVEIWIMAEWAAKWILSQMSPMCVEDSNIVDKMIKELSLLKSQSVR